MIAPTAGANRALHKNEAAGAVTAHAARETLVAKCRLALPLDYHIDGRSTRASAGLARPSVSRSPARRRLHFGCGELNRRFNRGSRLLHGTTGHQRLALCSEFDPEEKIIKLLLPARFDH
jgi:hypothetical protein